MIDAAIQLVLMHAAPRLPKLPGMRRWQVGGDEARLITKA